MKFRFIVIFVAVIAILGFIGQNFSVLNPYNGVWQTESNVVYKNETLKIQGLYSNVTVLIDNQGIAHIIANNDHDLFFMQGYYSAQNRLFQMELQVLAASGNLSSVLGESALSSDIAMHMIGIPFIAQKILNNYKENYTEYYEILEYYCEGINAYINGTDSYSLGFKLLNIKPFLWSPMLVIDWNLYMAWSLTTGAFEPLLSALFYAEFGYNQTMEIWPFYPYFTENLALVPGDGGVNGYTLTLQGIDPEYLWSLNWYEKWATGIDPSSLKNLENLMKSALTNISDPYLEEFQSTLKNSLGSNSWVVTSKRSASGYPMLANDPHLQLFAPSLWLPMQLRDPNYNVTGWDLVGVPGILIGHTENTAWGLTTPEGNSANDYLEILNGNNYLFNGTWHKMEIENYTLLGKTYSVYFTNNGPLISKTNNMGISLNWANGNYGYDLLAELMLDKSNNYTDMMNALKHWGIPPQNFALVSKDHAGYITAGSYPTIKEILPNGKTVQVIGSRSLLNGTIENYEPSGIVPYQYLPQTVDPSRGFAFAPNQPTVWKNYPYPFIGGYWSSGGRAMVIYSYLSNKDNLTIQDMMNLQSNITDYWAMMFKPYILNALKGMQMNETELQAFNSLASWNCSAYINSTGMTVYWYFLTELYNLSFAKMYNEHNISGFQLPFTTTLIYLAMNDPNSLWFNGNFTNLAKESFKGEITFLSKNIGNNVNNWTWGRVHVLEIFSQTGLSSLSIGPIPFYGDDHTVSVGSASYDLIVPVTVTVSSSLRLIASPGNSAFYGIFPGGPSENILSPYFSNQLDMWYDHEYYNLENYTIVAVIKYE